MVEWILSIMYCDYKFFPFLYFLVVFDRCCQQVYDFAVHCPHTNNKQSLKIGSTQKKIPLFIYRVPRRCVISVKSIGRINSPNC